MRGVLCAVLAALLVGGGTAAAEDSDVPKRSIVVVPFTAVGVSIDEAARLTNAAVLGAQRAGFSAEQAKIAMADLLAINGCESNDDACLATLPETLGCDLVIFGSARIEGGAAALLVIIVEPGTDKIRKRIPLSAATAMERASESEDALAQTLGEPAAPPAVDEPVGPAVDAEVEQTTRSGFDTSRVDRRSWLVGGAGLAAVVTGGLVLVVGENRQSAINDAPTDTRSDLEDLEGLETQARVLFGVGNILVVGGVIATAIGGALIFHQSRPRGEAQVIVAPTLGRGSAGVVVRVVGWK